MSFPLWLAAAVLALPLWAPAEAMCHFKIQDAAFRNTVRFAFRLLGMPVLVLLWAIPAFIFLPCWIAALLLIGVLFSYSLFYDWLNLVRR